MRAMEIKGIYREKYINNNTQMSQIGKIKKTNGPLNGSQMCYHLPSTQLSQSNGDNRTIFFPLEVQTIFKVDIHF